MTLQEQLMADMKTAMKAKDMAKLSVVRLIRSEVKNWEIDNGTADDSAVQTIIKRMAKQQLDALGDFKKAERQDLIEETEAKIEILNAYLPQQMDNAALKTIVEEVVTASENKDFGPLMGQVMKKVANQADGGRVSAMLKQVLAA